MATIAPIAPATALPTETPSKQAAAALKEMSLNQTPTKPSKLNFEAFAEDDDEHKVVAITPAKPDLAALRKRFVGDIELEEKDEPLLKESRRRFVLFPIQYREVSNLVVFSVVEA